MLHKFALALALAGAAAPAFGYQGGALVSHSHSTSAGQGGSTLSPATITVTTLTATSATISTLTATSATIGSLSLTGINASTVSVSGTIYSSGTLNQSGPLNASQSVTFSSAVFGAYVEISSGVLVGSTSFTFPSAVITSSAAYILEWTLLQNTANGHLTLRFNGDSGANYRWSAKNNKDNTDEVQAVSIADTSGRMTSTNLIAGQFSNGHVRFQSAFSRSSTVMYRFQHEYVEGNAGVSGEQHGGGVYTGAADLTSVTLLTSGGTISGTIKLYRRWDK